MALPVFPSSHIPDFPLAIRGNLVCLETAAAGATVLAVSSQIIPVHVDLRRDNESNPALVRQIQKLTNQLSAASSSSSG